MCALKNWLLNSYPRGYEFNSQFILTEYWTSTYIAFLIMTIKKRTKNTDLKPFLTWFGVNQSFFCHRNWVIQKLLTHDFLVARAPWPPCCKQETDTWDHLLFEKQSVHFSPMQKRRGSFFHPRNPIKSRSVTGSFLPQTELDASTRPACCLAGTGGIGSLFWSRQGRRVCAPRIWNQTKRVTNGKQTSRRCRRRRFYILSWIQIWFSHSLRLSSCLISVTVCIGLNSRWAGVGGEERQRSCYFKIWKGIRTYIYGAANNFRNTCNKKF